MEKNRNEKRDSLSVAIIVAVIAALLAVVALAVAVLALSRARQAAPGEDQIEQPQAGQVEQVAGVVVAEGAGDRGREPDHEFRQRARKWIAENSNTGNVTELRWWPSVRFEYSINPPEFADAIKLKWRDGQQLRETMFSNEGGGKSVRAYPLGPGSRSDLFPE